MIKVAKNLFLQLAEKIDTKEFYEQVIANRIHLIDWVPFAANMKERYDAEVYIFDAMRYNEGGQKLTYFIKEADKLIGSVGLFKIDKVIRKAEIGYWMSEAHTGKGIAKKSVKAMLKYAFEELNLNRIEARIATQNEASKYVVKSIGFKLEGTMRQDAFINDKYHDMEVYGILKKEF